MTYLIIQILTLLVAATILGLGIGWLIRAFSAKRVEHQLNNKLHQSAQSVPPLKKALSRAQADSEDKENIITELQETLGERKEALDDALRSQREIEAQRDQIERQMASATADLERTNRAQAADNEQQIRALRGELENERNRMREALKGKESEYEQACRKSEQLKARIDQLQKENDRWHAGNAEKEAQIARLSQSLARTEGLKNDLESQVIELKRSLAEAERELQSRVADLTNALNNEKANLSNVRETVARGEAKLEALGEQLNDRARELDRMETQARSQHDTIEKLQQQYTVACSELAGKDAEHSGKIAALKIELERQKGFLENAERQLRDDVARREQLQDALNRLHAEMQSATTAGAEREKQLTIELEKYRLEAARMSAENDRAQRQVEALNRDLSQTRAELENKALSLLEAGKGAVGVQEQNARANDAIHALAQKESELKSAENNADRAITALKVELDQTRNKSENDKKDIAALEKTLSAETDRLKKAQDDLATQKEKADQLRRDEAEKAQAKIDSAIERLNQEQRRNNDILAAQNNTKDQNKTHSDKIGGLEKALADEKARVSEANRELAQLKAHAEEKLGNEKDKALARLESAKDKLEDERRLFKEKIDKADKENESQKAVIAALENSLALDKAQRAGLNKELAAIEQKAAEKYAYEQEKAQTRIDALKDKLDDERGRYKELVAAEKKHADKIEKELKEQTNKVVKLEKVQHGIDAAKEKATERYANAQEKAQIRIDALKDKLDEERGRHKELVAAEKKHADKIENELKAQNTKVAKLEKAHSDSESQLADAVWELEALAQQKNEVALNEREKAQHGIDAAKEKLEDERRQFKQTLGALQKQIDNGEKEYGTQKAAVAALENSLALEKTQHAEVVKKLAATEEKAAEKYANEKEKAQHGIDATKEKLEDERRQFKQTLGALQKQIDNSEKEHGSQTAAVAALEKSLALEKAQHAEVVKQLAATEEKAAEKYANEKEKAQHGIDATKEKLKDERRQFKQTLGALQKQIDNSEKEYGSHKAAVATLEKSLATEKAQHAEVVKQLAATEEKAAEKYANEKEKAQHGIDATKEKLEDERRQFKQTLGALQKQIDNGEKEHKSQKATATALEKSLALEKAQHAQVVKKLAATEEKAAEKYANEQEKAQTKIDALKDKLDDERGRYKELVAAEKKHADKIENELKAQNNKVAKLEKAHSESESQLDEAIWELETLAQQKNEVALKEKEKAQAKIDALKDKLSNEQRRLSEAVADSRRHIKKLDQANAKLEQSKQSLSDAKMQEKVIAQQLNRVKDKLANQKHIVADTKAAKKGVDDELKKVVTAMHNVEKSGTQARAKAKSRKAQLNTLDRALDKSNSTLDELSRKLDEREKIVETRTRERDQYDHQSQSLRDQLGELKSQIDDLAKANENLHKNSKQSELSWQEKIIKQTSVESDLRTHIKKLETLVSAELRNARHGILNRIDNMEAALDLESQRIEEDNKEKHLSIVDRKAS